MLLDASLLVVPLLGDVGVVVVVEVDVVVVVVVVLVLVVVLAPSAGVVGAVVSPGESGGVGDGLSLLPPSLPLFVPPPSSSPPPSKSKAESSMSKDSSSSSMDEE
jgi:hypothetical protein